MKLRALVDRNPAPTPWAEGDNIPWSDPEFSERMLREHLTQEHDMASRTTPLIERQISWVQDTLLGGQCTHILDLGCGPGLYANRLAQLGHRCTGIDYSPASITYAREHDTTLSNRFVHGDLRETDFGAETFDLAMLLFGETNVFSPPDIRLILSKAARALKPGGKLLLEPHTFEIVKEIGESGATWYTSDCGLFSAEPHLLLSEHFWDEKSRTATIRHYVVEVEGGAVFRHAQSLQAYDDMEYTALLEACGFQNVQIWPNLGDIEQFTGHLMAITASVA